MNVGSGSSIFQLGQLHKDPLFKTTKVARNVGESVCISSRTLEMLSKLYCLFNMRYRAKLRLVNI